MLRNLLTITFMFCLVLGIDAQITLVKTIEFEGTERSYRFRIPEAHDETTPLPLVFNFHGRGSDGLQQEFYSGMNTIADTAGFYVAYPDGIDNEFNVGWIFGSDTDDVGFTLAMIEAISAEYPVKQDQIYSCGMSNGGFLSYSLACEMNDRIAAIASVTGAIAPLYIDQCDPGRAVPVLQIHGTEDGTVGYDGTEGVNISMDELLQFWSTNNGCDGNIMTTDLEDINTNDGTTAQKIDYQNCEAPVEHFKIEGGGHTWPGAIIDIGVTNRDFNASEAIWHFFRQHTLPDNVSSTTDLAEALPFEIMPNPGRDQLTITTVETPYQLRLYASTGQLLLAENRQQQGPVDVSDLPKGLYLVQISKDGQSASQQWVKQ